jgi:hypothetical protein
VEKQLLEVPWQTNTTGPLPSRVYSIGPLEVRAIWLFIASFLSDAIIFKIIDSCPGRPSFALTPAD